jgi:hypothetical protein
MDAVQKSAAEDEERGSGEEDESRVEFINC